MSIWKPYFNKLQGDQCACGRLKARKMSFCRDCYHMLPAGAQRALYRRIGEGYEEAYDHAVEILTIRERIKKEVPDD